MTNKEAIAKLNGIYGVVSPTVQKAIDVAIKAISTVEQVHNTDDSKNRIGDLLDILCLSDLSKDELFTNLDKMSINDIKDHMWELYCFVSDVCDIVNERGDV